MRNSRVANLIAGLTFCAAGLTLYLATHSLPPPLERRPHEAAGATMAAEALSLLKPGGQIMVITRDTTSFSHPETDLQLRSFTKAITAAHVAIAATQTLQVDPLRPIEVPAGDFFEWIRKTPAGSVIVSFMGPPLLTEAQIAQLGDIKPKIVAFCPGVLPQQIDLRRLFESKLLHSAVISRLERPKLATKPKDAQGWFDSCFRIVNAANVGSLYAAP